MLRFIHRNATALQGDSLEQGGSLAFVGGNIRILDDGVLYHLLKEQWGIQNDDVSKPHSYQGLWIKSRTGLLSGSSHHSDEDQYEVQIPKVGVVLIGFSQGQLNQAGRAILPAHTWIQSEAHAANYNFSTSLKHGLDFVRHKYTGKQVGALGYSPYSEKETAAQALGNPLVCYAKPYYTMSLFDISFNYTIDTYIFLWALEYGTRTLNSPLQDIDRGLNGITLEESVGETMLYVCFEFFTRVPEEFRCNQQVKLLKLIEAGDFVKRMGVLTFITLFTLNVMVLLKL